MTDAQSQDRQQWMGILARAEETSLAQLVAGLDDLPEHDFLRRPESGLVMVRGRAGGSGKAFNLGEMTVTRCTVRTEDGTLGHAYVAGRRPDHAARAALTDALLQHKTRRDEIMRRVIVPLEQEETARCETKQAESADTRVDFFTLVRGENE
ncbi:MAG: phosphonate C-P lyase system protein PhnG [Hyphomicrobiaceae bacterium]|nr:phosphonate C-P lyase system protein PhnG [Hyphomicrobiaceae bacterium]